MQAGRLTVAKAVKPDEASHKASMKSRVAPKVLCLRRGEEGGDMTSGSGETCSLPSTYLCLSAPPKLKHRTNILLHETRLPTRMSYQRLCEQ